MCWPARPPHLVAVPAGADPVIVVPNGDPAEGAEKRCDLDVEDVGQVALKLSSHQEYLKDGRSVAVTTLHDWTNTKQHIQRLIKRKRCAQNLPRCLLDWLLSVSANGKHRK